MSALHYHWFPCEIDQMDSMNLDMMTCNRWHSRHHYYRHRALVLKKPKNEFMVMHVSEYGRSCDDTDTLMNIYKLQITSPKKAKILYDNGVPPDDFDLTSEMEIVLKGYDVDTENAVRYEPETLDMDFQEIHIKYAHAFSSTS